MYILNDGFLHFSVCQVPRVIRGTVNVQSDVVLAGTSVSIICEIGYAINKTHGSAVVSTCMDSGMFAHFGESVICGMIDVSDLQKLINE